MGLIPRELGSTIVGLRVSFCTNTILNKKQGKKERKRKGRGGIGIGSEKRKSRRVGEGVEAGRTRLARLLGGKYELGKRPKGCVEVSMWDGYGEDGAATKHSVSSTRTLSSGRPM